VRHENRVSAAIRERDVLGPAVENLHAR